MLNSIIGYSIGDNKVIIGLVTQVTENGLPVSIINMASGANSRVEYMYSDVTREKARYNIIVQSPNQTSYNLNVGEAIKDHVTARKDYINQLYGLTRSRTDAGRPKEADLVSKFSILAFNVQSDLVTIRHVLYGNRYGADNGGSYDWSAMVDYLSLCGEGNRIYRANFSQWVTSGIPTGFSNKAKWNSDVISGILNNIPRHEYSELLATSSSKSALIAMLQGMVLVKDEYTVKEVFGDGIRKAYLSGPQSCMIDRTGSGKYVRNSIALYAENPERCSLFEIYRQGEFMGRALKWIADDGRHFLDRIYPESGNHIRFMKEFAKKNGWDYKENQSFGSLFASGRTVYEVTVNNHNKLAHEKLGWPYMDTLRIADSIDGDKITLRCFFDGPQQATNHDRDNGNVDTDIPGEWFLGQTNFQPRRRKKSAISDHWGFEDRMPHIDGVGHVTSKELETLFVLVNRRNGTSVNMRKDEAVKSAASDRMYHKDDIVNTFEGAGIGWNETTIIRHGRVVYSRDPRLVTVLSVEKDKTIRSVGLNTDTDITSLEPLHRGVWVPTTEVILNEQGEKTTEYLKNNKPFNSPHTVGRTSEADLWDNTLKRPVPHVLVGATAENGVMRLQSNYFTSMLTSDPMVMGLAQQAISGSVDDQIRFWSTYPMDDMVQFNERRIREWAAANGVN